MATKIVKIEDSIVVKEELEVNRNANIKVKLETEQEPHVVEDITREEKKPSTTKHIKKEKLGFDEGDLHTCIHCGEKRTSEEMAHTPETQKELWRWSRFLGEQFYINVQNSTSSMVCRSHFVDEFGDSQLTDRFCGNNIVKTTIDSKKNTCCYCGKSRIRKYMTNAPKDQNSLVKWGEILGNKFSEHFKLTSHGFVCRSHFDVEWQGQRPKELLPVADLDKNVEENVVTIRDDYKRPEKKRTCAYCEKLTPCSDVTKVPQNPAVFKQWVDKLGKQFYKRVISKTQAFICRSHFEIEWQEVRPKELLPVDDLNRNQIDEESEEHVDIEHIGYRRMVPIRNRTCDYCEKSTLCADLTQVPQNPVVFKQWVDIFGEEFYRRASAKVKSFVCRSHFDVEWQGTRPKELLPVADLNRESHDKESEEHIDYDFERVAPIQKRTCYYCGEKKPRRDMTWVPQNPLILKEWGDILGEDFYKRASKVRSFICRSHFDVEWEDRRPCNVLPCAKPDQVISNQAGEENDEEDFIIQDGPSDMKKIKLEIEEE